MSSGPPTAGSLSPTPAVHALLRHSHPSNASNASSSSSGSIRIVHELFDSCNDLGHEQALSQLDAFLADKCQYIVIEPTRLADETQRWIAVGNYLNRNTLGFGCLALITAGVSSRSWFIWAPFSAVSLMSWLAYYCSWQHDPCCSYQVVRDPLTIGQILYNGNGDAAGKMHLSRYQPGWPAPCVIEYKDDRANRIVQNTMAVSLSVLVLGSIWRAFRSA